MKEWIESSLGEISCYINRGFSPRYVESDGELIFNQKCIRDGRIDIAFAKFTDKEKTITSDKILRKNDILINSTGVGTAGRVALVRSSLRATVDSHVSIVRIDANKADPIYIFYSLRPREVDIESFAEGSTGQIELGRERVNNHHQRWWLECRGSKRAPVVVRYRLRAALSLPGILRTF